MSDDKNLPKDIQLWKNVASTVKPLKKGSSKPDQLDLSHHLHVEPMRALVGAKTHAKKTVRQDKKTRRGKVEIDTKIDLHDLTRDAAFDAFRRVIIRSYNQNLNCVLVVTGKGMRGQGVLRQSFTQWVDDPDIRHIISEYAPAHFRHGGSGAWYVFLKSRKGPLA